MDRDIERRFEQQEDLSRNIVSRGTVPLVGDGGKMQTNQLKLLDGEVIAGAERFEQYGITANPPAGSECLVVFVGGDRSHPVVIAANDRGSRPGGQSSGEVKIYTDEGDSITLKRGNEIVIKTKKLTVHAEDSVDIQTKTFTVSASTGVNMTTPALALGGDGGDAQATFTGGLTASGDVVSGGISAQTHTHTGVQSGGDSSGQPQ